MADPLFSRMVSRFGNGACGFLSCQNVSEGRFSIVEDDVVRVGEDGTVAHLPQFRRGVSAAQNDPHVGVAGLELLSAAQCGEQVAGEGDGE